MAAQFCIVAAIVFFPSVGIATFSVVSQRGQTDKTMENMPIKSKTVTIKKERDGNHNCQSKTDQSDKFAKLVGFLETIRNQGFTGYIKINLSQGSIGRVEKFEEILKP